MNKYSKSVIEYKDRTRNKMRMSNPKVGDHGLTFVKLTSIVPNWQTYLTQKQLECAELYLQGLDCPSIDTKLDLRIGATQERLFSDRGERYRNALYRLKFAYKQLKEKGYYERLEKQKGYIGDKVNNN